MSGAESARARFRRSLLTKNMTLIDLAARELPEVTLIDALRILVVMAEKHDERFDRAAGRWAQRAADEAEISIAKSWPLLAQMPHEPHDIAAALRELIADSA